jgi:hypothetical protein
MTLRLVTLLFLTFSLSVFAQGRKPAVEDFVGIEVEHPEETPQGTEALFNFEKEMTHYEQNAHQAPVQKIVSTSEQGWGFSHYLGLTLLIGLPIMTWSLVMNHMRKRASFQNASNIEVLEKYRKERELAKKGQEKKVA